MDLPVFEGRSAVYLLNPTPTKELHFSVVCIIIILLGVSIRQIPVVTAAFELRVEIKMLIKAVKNTVSQESVVSNFCDVERFPAVNFPT